MGSAKRCRAAEMERQTKTLRSSAEESLSGPSKGSVGQRTNHDVPKLHIARMTLQTDVAGGQARVVGRNLIICHGLTVERYFYSCVRGLYFRGNAQRSIPDKLFNSGQQPAPARRP